MLTVLLFANLVVGKIQFQLGRWTVFKCDTSPDVAKTEHACKLLMVSVTAFQIEEITPIPIHTPCLNPFA